MSTVLSITPTRVIASGGKFDSQKRYFRVGAGAFLPIIHDRSMDLVNTGPEFGLVLALRYSVNGYVRQHTKRFKGTFGVSQVNPGVYNTTVTLTKFV